VEVFHFMEPFVGRHESVSNDSEIVQEVRYRSHPNNWGVMGGGTFKEGGGSLSFRVYLLPLFPLTPPFDWCSLLMLAFQAKTRYTYVCIWLN